MRILIVEDDQKLSQLIVKMLEKDGYVCDTAFELSRASEKINNNSSSFDAILLDVGLPDGNGTEFCKQLRASGITTPIIMLTGRSSTVDKVSGLDAGADDYIPKPFSPNELKARLRAILRRPKSAIADEIVCGEIRLNILARSVEVQGQPVELMPKEFSLLEYLMRKKNEVVKKDELLRHVWGVYSNTSSNRLEVYIRYLREKIDLPFKTNTIQTVRGAGYKIAEK